jgi:hypothetical protein
MWRDFRKKAKCRLDRMYTRRTGPVTSLTKGQRWVVDPTVHVEIAFREDDISLFFLRSITILSIGLLFTWGVFGDRLCGSNTCLVFGELSHPKQPIYCASLHWGRVVVVAEILVWRPSVHIYVCTIYYLWRNVTSDRHCLLVNELSCYM